MKKTILLVFLLMITGAAVAQQAVDLNPISDNTLYEDANGALSNGSGSFLFSGRVENRQSGLIRRGLLRFDIAADIPAGATIESVTLTMFMSRGNGGARDISLHRVSADWGEGSSDASGQEGGGASSTNPDATWIHRIFNSDTWTNPGGDFESSPVAIHSVDGVGSYTWDSNSDLVALVQDWLDNPDDNFGILLRGDESTVGTAKRFDSRENITAANRPVLAITYSGVQVSNEEDTDIPTVASLEQNFPNPFNPTTNIRFTLSEVSSITLNVYNVLGQQVANVANGRFNAGQHTFTFDASTLSSGVYIFQLRSGSTLLTRKMTLIK